MDVLCSHSIDNWIFRTGKHFRHAMRIGQGDRLRKLLLPVLALLVFGLLGCGGSDEDGDTAVSDRSGEADVVSQMNLEEDGDTWTFETETGESCTVEQVLTTPSDVQARENDGDVVVVNSAGSVGVVLPADVSDFCYDAAEGLLEEM